MKTNVLTVKYLVLAMMICVLLVLSACGSSDIDDSELNDTEDDPLAETYTQVVAPTPQSFFTPRATENTHPDLLLISTAIMADGQIVDSYNLTPRTHFDIAKEYTVVQGITTFRGNNFRDSSSYGRARIQDAKFSVIWTQSVGALTAPDGIRWPGFGWTGQPLITKWPREVRVYMNMYEWAKEQEDLVEVIYPSMDGHIYFTELETGKPTRENLFIGWTFKGCGTIDPRGYPLLYVGAGYDSVLGSARIFIISLIDGSILYTFGDDDPFAPRNLPEPHSYADAAPLIDIENDRLIYASENGLLYIINLNSRYWPEFGSISIAPSDVVKWRFIGNRHERNGHFWFGFEASPAILEGHVFLCENGGHLVCLDLNTLETVWVKDLIDDVNNTPVISMENEHPYVYISTAFCAGWRPATDGTAVVPIWKVDAVTGETVWQVDYQCNTRSGLSGGVNGTIGLGKHDLNDLVFVPVARTPTVEGGVLAAISKSSGTVVWEYKTEQYVWSSPVCVYDENGKGYIVLITSSGQMLLLDGLTGERYDSISIEAVTEATPAIYENTIVVGTKGQRIWGIKLT